MNTLWPVHFNKMNMKKILIFLLLITQIGQAQNLFARQNFAGGGVPTFNTYIGGVSGSITSATQLGVKLGISNTRITNFTIVGSDIKCKITGGSYVMPDSAFKSITTLTYFNDADGLVTLLNFGCFNGCTALTSISFPNCTTITSNGSFTNAVFQNCTALTSVNLPAFASDASAKDFMFQNCTSLTSLSFPSYTGKIGAYMFQGCTNLVSVNLTISGVVGENSYVGTKITTVNLALATSIGNSAFQNITTLVGSISAPVSTTIGSSSFTNTRITSITASCTSIAATAFYNCTALTTISFPNCTTITSSGFAGTSGTFQNCTALTSVSLPLFASDASSKDSMFQNCPALTTLSFPSYTGKIGTYMFNGGTNLTSISIGISGAVGDNAYEGTKITTINLANATTLGNSVFLNVTTLVGAITTNATTIDIYNVTQTADMLS